MANWRAARLLACATFTFGLIGLAMAPAAADEDPEPEKSHLGVAVSVEGPRLPIEEDSTRVENYADSVGGLGVYYDNVERHFVIRIPASGNGNDIKPGRISIDGIEAYALQSRTTASTVASILAVIAERKWHAQAAQYIYGFYYDAASDIISVNTNAPQAVVQPLLDRFPNLLSYQYGTGGRNSRSIDNPHTGEALHFWDPNHTTGI